MKEFGGIKNALGNSSTFYLVAIDMECRYFYVNKYYKQVFEKIHGNLTGQPFSVTTHPEDLEISRQVLSKAMANPSKSVVATIRKYDGKGGYRITKWECKALFDEHNKACGLYCMGQDLTESMQNRTDLQHVKESLRKTQYTLEEIAQAHAHEFRKHTANILGLVVLLETMEMSPEIDNIFKMINRSIKKLDELIRKNIEKNLPPDQ